jgi:hypothetical protein
MAGHPIQAIQFARQGWDVTRRSREGTPARVGSRAVAVMARGKEDRGFLGGNRSFWGNPQLAHPHFESPQFKQVLQPSIITTAAMLHFVHSCAPSGKCDFENASVCLARASNSARFCSTSLR